MSTPFIETAEGKIGFDSDESARYFWELGKIPKPISRPEQPVTESFLVLGPC